MPLPSSPPRKRGRPRRDTRPGEILDAGFRVFAEKGFAAARLDDVATRAGVAKGTVYLYYPSKDALFEAAVRARILPVVGDARDIALQQDLPARVVLTEIIRAIYGRISDPDARTLLRIMIADGHQMPSLVAFYHREVIARMTALLRGVVQRGVARGEFTAGALSDVPEVLIAPAMMGAIWQMTFTVVQPIPLETFLAAHVDLLTRALTPPATAAQ